MAYLLVVSDSWWPHRLQHTRLPFLHYLPEFAQTHIPWVNEAIQPSLPVAPFSSYLQSFPAYGYIPMLFTSGDTEAWWIKKCTERVCLRLSWGGQFSSVAQSCPTFCDSMDCTCQASLSFTNSWSLLKLMSIELVMPSNHLILCRTLLLLSSIFPSIKVSSNESVLHIRWPKYWSFSFSISPSGEYSGLISFRMNWLDLLAVQGTLKSLLQNHNSKASIRHLNSKKFKYI